MLRLGFDSNGQRPPVSRSQCGTEGDLMKVDKDQFDEALKGMLQKPLKKTAKIKIKAASQTVSSEVILLKVSGGNPASYMQCTK
jgi:hypothetical protein